MSLLNHEIICVATVSAVVSFLVSVLFYDDYHAALLLAVPFFLVLNREYKKIKRKRYEKKFIYQFEEMLESLSVALQTGYSLENALEEVRKQMLFMYGYRTEVIKELDIICRGIKVNIPVERLLNEMSARINIPVVAEYAHVVETAKRYGGNLIEITKQKMYMLRDKRMVSDEIDAMITGKKYESLIMNVMPILILLYLKLTSYEMVRALYSNIAGNAIMTVLLVCYVLTVMLGKHITDFEKNSIHVKKEGYHKNKKGKCPFWLKKLNSTFLKSSIDSVNKKLSLLSMSSDTEQVINCFWTELGRRLAVSTVCSMIFILYGCVCDFENIYIYLIIATVIIYGFPYTMISKLKNNMSIRNNQLEVDYTELIEKLILFLGAGMSMKGCFIKIAEEYEETVKKGKWQMRYLYEEIVYVSRQLKNGMAEVVVYESFGKRCGSLAYMRLTTLLAQNLKKGNSDLLGKLRMTSLDSFENRKIVMKKLGEKASSKLLMPMMLQFVIILVIIMYPAMTMSR